MTVVSNRIANTCNMSGSTGAVICNISKAFGRVWRTGLLQKLKSYGISGQIFGLISSSQSFASSGSSWEVFTRISSYCWCSSSLHYWSNTFLDIY